MSYKLFLKQTEYGCDYTIGCGAKLIDLTSSDIETAKLEAAEKIGELTCSEQQIETAYIVQVTEDLSYLGPEALEVYKREKKKEAMQIKKEQLERLNAELEGK